MKLRLLAAFTVAGVGAAPSARAGGLFLPGSGAVSTSRAGAAVASADDGEALSLNPAGLSKTKGTTITLSAAIITYAMKFARSGTYDLVDDQSYPYEGQAYPTVKNDPSLPLGIGKYQPVPVFAVVSDLGGKVPNLRVAAGVYAPNAYPFRDMCTEEASGCRKYTFNGDFNEPPSPVRYDIVSQDAAVILPSIAGSYRIMPNLDVGARLSAGFAHLKSSLVIWGLPGNIAEDVKKDAQFHVDVKDNFMPTFGLGSTFRPTPAIELAAAFNYKISVSAKGDATSELGPNAGLPGSRIVAQSPEAVRCEQGGTDTVQKACVELELPMNATLAGRYKFLGKDGKQRGDVELDLGWENWSSSRASDFRVVVDAQVVTGGSNDAGVGLKDSIVAHGLKDVFTARLGGSYVFPINADSDLTVRGGFGYDTAAAKTGWLRADLDGAARKTLTIGAGYRTKRFEINAGGGAILEGSPSNNGECNPISTQPDMKGCNGDGIEHPVGSPGRQGPDPTNPLVLPSQQTEAPVNRGTYTSHYVLFMLGATTWF